MLRGARHRNARATFSTLLIATVGVESINVAIHLPSPYGRPIWNAEWETELGCVCQWNLALQFQCLESKTRNTVLITPGLV